MAAHPLRVNIIIPPLDREKFTGGSVCILEHAHQLHRRGHQVTLIPTRPSLNPDWFPKEFGTLQHWPRQSAISGGLDLVGSLATWVLNKSKGSPAHIRRDFMKLVCSMPKLWTPEMEQAVHAQILRKLIPEADITIATQYDTALPVYLFGSGKLAYFMQHYEVVFANDSSDPDQTRKRAALSYKIGLNMMANSPWLLNQVKTAVPEANVMLTPSAIDHAVFNGTPKPIVPADHRKVTLISYGGRNVAWKGFKEMAEATAIARRELPDYQIEWHVYGTAALPPNNDIAPYKSLGFLQPSMLAEAYRASDILLSASWYESFPLFPAEAMACGLPVVTTQPGTEQYAIPGETAEVVAPQSPRSVADGLIRLIRDHEYRHRIAVAGWKETHKLTWDAAGDAMEANIRAIINGEQPS
ncbi:glycosyltransferase family 4 protein [Niveispirillum irakense]|uniref:glycosyltransferase family 4 protein n=1 Tax=Niveispirillum irakense TaxID=34011 RepID=UPI000403EC1F|nr:glycosyltransferase family 4 protein [Niveispirillum irakense]